MSQITKNSEQDAEQEEKEFTEQNWPFDVWLRLAVLHMHISPNDFWDMNLRDWFALCRRQNPVQFSQLDLENMMQTFPDKLSVNPDQTKKDN